MRGAVVVGHDVVQDFVLEPGQTRPALADGRPLLLVALQYRVIKVLCDAAVEVTCGLCSDADRRTLCACRLGEWTYEGSTMRRNN